MTIRYDKFFCLLKKKRISPGSLVREGLISRSSLRRLKENRNVDLFTLDLISARLGCEILDLISFSESADPSPDA